MKKTLIPAIIALSMSSFVFGQVGINTTDPKATFDIHGTPADATKLDGIIAPRLTGNELANKTYTADQTGAMVYVTAAAGPLVGQVINVAAAGYYYFDGLLWQAVANGASASSSEPWYNQATGTAATTNTQNIYQTGKVATGFDNSLGYDFGHQLNVKGHIATKRWNQAPNLVQTRYNGTEAAPTAVLADDQVGAISFEAFAGGGISGARPSVANITSWAAENTTASASAGKLVFATVPVGTITPNQRMTIDDKGNVGIGLPSAVGLLRPSNPTNKLHVSATINPVRIEGLVDAAPVATDAIVYVDNTGVLKKSTTSVGSLAGADLTNDAWINNTANTRVELGTNSDGTTARTAGTAYAINDKGATLQGDYTSAIAGLPTGAAAYNVKNLNSDILPTVASGRSLYTNYNSVNLLPGFSPNANITGVLEGVTKSSTNTSNYGNIRSLVEDSQLFGSGSVTSIGAITGRASLYDTNTATTVTAVEALTRIGGSSTATNGYGFKSTVTAETSSTLTNGYSFYGSFTKTGTAAITNAYGLYLDNINQGSALNYAIYTNAGKVRLGDLAAGAATDNFVTIDANGVLTKSTATASGAANNWALTGNAGTTAGTNFLGTTDAQGLIFKVNNLQAGFLDPVQNNTAFGTSAGSSVVYPAGFQNTAIGFEALKNNTDRNNTGIGNAALKANTTGRSNTAVGNSAMIANTTGFDNVAVGESLKSNTTGAGNIVVGKVALDTNVSGNNNTAMGWQTLRFSTGSENTAFGNAAANQLTAGDKNIAIGSNVQLASNTGSNQMNIGNIIFGTGMNGTLAAPAGNIGIGTSAPLAKLHISDPAGLAYFPTQQGSALSIDVSPTTTNNAAGTAVTVRNNIENTYNKTQANAGSFSAETATGSTIALTDLRGTLSQAVVRGSGNITTYLKGSLQLAANTSTSTVTLAYGSHNQIMNTGAGIITEARGTSSDIINSGGGTITNAYGNYIGSIAGTNKWSLYAADATAPSYLAGRLGLGTTVGVAPAAKLHVVKAAADLTPAIIEGTQDIADANADGSTNDEATTAGIPVGGLYRTGDLLKIRH